MNILHFFAQTLTPGTGQGQVNIPTVQADSATLANLLGTVYGIAGTVCVIIVIIAGYMYVTSAGNSAQTVKAKNAILYAVIGLVIILLAFVITQFVLGRF